MSPAVLAANFVNVNAAQLKHCLGCSRIGFFIRPQTGSKPVESLAYDNAINLRPWLSDEINLTELSRVVVSKVVLSKVGHIARVNHRAIL
jgi:hypothetical protein